MRIFFIISLVITCSLSLGCAKKLTREEFLAVNEANNKSMTREYKGIGKERIVEACEKSLLSSDAKYEITQHMENGFYAKRRWSIYMIIAFASGENHWKITIEDKGEFSRVEAKSWVGDGVAAGPLPVPIPGKTENEYYISPSLYKLFFDRVDYFLGLRPDWVTCKTAEENMHPYEAGVGPGLESLCTVVRSKDPTKPKEDPKNDHIY